MERPIRIRLHVLSPIHIGCDDIYEPTSFVINSEKKKLVSFDPIVFVKSLSKEEITKLNEITAKANMVSIIELYRFIYEKRDRIKGREIEIANDIIKRYIEVKDMPLNEKIIKQELNKFVIPRTAYNPITDLPYIPGSSLKGSIRTGYLSMMALGGGNQNGLKGLLEGKESKTPIKGRTNSNELEKELLKGSFSEDPFRLLKISDLLPIGVNTKIIYAINYRKNNASAGRGIPQIFETIQPGSIFEGNIEVLMPVNGTGIKEPLEKDLLFRVVNKHYANIYNNEIKMAKNMLFKMPPASAYAQKIKEKSGNRPFLIRLGRHSGAEAVTIEGNRKITIRGRGGRINYGSESTTIWLASENIKPNSFNSLIPFGWAMVEIC